MRKILLLLLGLIALAGCQRIKVEKEAKAIPASGEQTSSIRTNAAVYGSAIKLADLQDRAIKESSGIVASRSTPGIYWTHNDSGDGPFIYAFDSGGKRFGVWRVANAQARDWEDIAAGPGPERGQKYLYIGDIGNNSGRRSEIIVYRVIEPQITDGDASSTKSQPRLTEAAEAIRLRYPQGTPNAEALLIHPQNGNLYIITKEAFANPTVYEATAPLTVGAAKTLVPVGKIRFPGLLGGLITGAAIAPDGRRVALCDYIQGYEMLLPETNTDFNAIWNQPPMPIPLGRRKQGEAISYRLDGKALLATSEGLPTPLIQVVRR